MWIDTALVLVCTGVIAGGVCGALIRTWSILTRLVSLETALAEVQGVQTREVKIRASGERGKRPEKEKQEILELVGNAKAASGNRVPNWWEKSGAGNGIP